MKRDRGDTHALSHGPEAICRELSNNDAIRRLSGRVPRRRLSGELWDLSRNTQKGDSTPYSGQSNSIEGPLALRWHCREISAIPSDRAIRAPPPDLPAPSSNMGMPRSASPTRHE